MQQVHFQINSEKKNQLDLFTKFLVSNKNKSITFALTAAIGGTLPRLKCGVFLITARSLLSA